MGDRSDDDSPYVISDEEDPHELEIKPPQAKLFKHSHSRHSDKHSRCVGRQVYVSSSRHHHKSHHSHRHPEERYVKDRFEVSRSAYTKEYEERVRKKAYHNSRSEERYKEQDLRVKLERRKRHHHKDYDSKDRKEKMRKERHRLESKEHKNHDERRRHHRDERERIRTPQEKHLHNVSDDSFSPVEKETVIDIETSPPVLRGDEYMEPKEEKMVEQEDEEIEESQNSERSSNSSSSDSSSSLESSEDSGSSESSSEEEAEEEQENHEMETNDVSEGNKEEISPKVATNDNDGVDSEIELEKDTLPSYYPAIQGCRSVEEFQCLNRIEEGTYGVVYRAREKRTDRIVALKRLKMEKEKNGFPITSLREINTLLKAQHPNIVTVKEIVVGSNMDKIFIVMDYVEHDLKSLMETMKQKKTCFTPSEVKCLMVQLLRAVNHLHNNWILHRDLKTSNLLFSHSGVLKVGDFGLAREYGSPLKHYTPIVVTLWYRAPELLLGTKEYSTSIDVWSVGCIFAELLCMEPLFPGKTDIDQLKRIFKALGTPNEKNWPDYPKFPLLQKVQLPEFPPHGIRPKFVPNILTDIGYNLLTSLLCYNTKKRITAEAALQHDYFSEHPLPIDPAMFSTWPAKSEPGYRKATANSPKPPSGGQNYKELRDDDGFYIGVGERGIHPAGFNTETTFSLKF